MTTTDNSALRALAEAQAKAQDRLLAADEALGEKTRLADEARARIVTDPEMTTRELTEAEDEARAAGIRRDAADDAFQEAVDALHAGWLADLRAAALAGDNGLLQEADREALHQKVVDAFADALRPYRLAVKAHNESLVKLRDDLAARGVKRGPRGSSNSLPERAVWSSDGGHLTVEVEGIQFGVLGANVGQQVFNEAAARLDQEALAANPPAPPRVYVQPDPEDIFYRV